MSWKRRQIKSGSVNENEKSMQLMLSAVCPSKREVKHNNHVEAIAAHKQETTRGGAEEQTSSREINFVSVIAFSRSLP